MTKRRKLFTHALIALALTVANIALAPRVALAKDPEFDAITQHLKLHFKARRVSIPFLGLANFFVRIIRPAGVKSFKVAIFEELDFTPGKMDLELGLLMRKALSTEWQPLVRTRSRGGEQFYVYAREAGENIKLLLVTVDHREALVARFKVSPQRLREFLQNPKLLGIGIRE